MATLLSLPILAVLVIAQSAVVSRVTLLQGSADLVLLVLVAWGLQPRVQNALIWAAVGGLLISFPTALPLGIPVAGYLAATILALILRRRVWQVPVLAMLVAIFLGTLITQGLAWVSLRILGVPLPALQSFYLVLLPSLLLNLLLAVPVYVLAGDLAGWLYPQEIEI
jgi:rod shape-determining protein MreD